jgi:hypothetical protein
MNLSHEFAVQDCCDGSAQARRKLLTALLILWSVPESYLDQYLLLSKPKLHEAGSDVLVGRAILPKLDSQAGTSFSTASTLGAPGKVIKAATNPIDATGNKGNHHLSSDIDGIISGDACNIAKFNGKDVTSFLSQVHMPTFAYTGQALRVMEAVAVATSQLEPVLLVGETGTGKTTIVQQIARQVELLPLCEVICTWLQAVMQDAAWIPWMCSAIARALPASSGCDDHLIL